MEIISKFNLGDKVFTIRNNKAREIEIKSITVDEKGVWYSDSEASYIYSPHKETECFATREELIKYICNDGDENV